MELIADVLLIAGALGAAFYCVVLSRRLSRFNDLETGVGGAIAVLSAQVDDMTRALNQAQGTAEGSADALEGLTERADGVAKRLELLVASMHDLPEVQADAGPPDPLQTGPDSQTAVPKPGRDAEFIPAEAAAFAHATRDEPPAAEPPAFARREPESAAADAPADPPAPTLFRSARSWSHEAAE